MDKEEIKPLTKEQINKLKDLLNKIDPDNKVFNNTKKLIKDKDKKS